MLPKNALYRSLCAALTFALLFLAVPLAAQAKASAQQLAQAVQRASSDPSVRAGGTTPDGPILSPNTTIVGLYAGTPAVIEEVCRLIETAQHEILFEIYQWNDDDEAGTRVREALRQRLQRAIAVPADGSAPQPLRIGIVINASWPAEAALHHRALLMMLQSYARCAPAHISIELCTYRGSLLSILHSKALSIDGQKTLVMTANLHTHGGLARDSFNVAALLQGPVVDQLRQDWFDARAQAHVEVSTPLGVNYLPAASADDMVALGTFVGRGPYQAALLTRQSQWALWDRGSSNPQAHGLLALIDGSQEQIHAINPALNAPALRAAILQAILIRHVRVELVLSLEMNRMRQHLFLGGDNADTAQSMYAALLAQGGPAAADRLSIYWGATDTGEVAPARDPGNIHAKIASFDDHCLLVGSTNWDWLSWNNSRELSVALFGDDVAVDFERDIFVPLRARSRPLRADDLPSHQRQASNPVYRYLLQR